MHVARLVSMNELTIAYFKVGSMQIESQRWVSNDFQMIVSGRNMILILSQHHWASCDIYLFNLLMAFSS